MKLLIASDIHIEFQKDRGATLFREFAQEPFDVLVCAGDLADFATLRSGLSELLDAIDPRPVVFTLGNHEYYGASKEQVFEVVGDVSRDFPGRLHWLERGTVTIDGQRFLGTTLWFEHHPTAPKRQMNDFYQIRNFQSWVYQDNAEAIAFLRKEVGPTDIVVTHHLPSYRSVHPRWAGSSLNPFFVCDMDDLIQERQPKLWIHGHTHNSLNYEIGESRVVCNPFGYARVEENPDFRSNYLVTV